MAAAAVPVPPVVDPVEVARKSVAESCDALLSRQTTMTTFDESKGAAAYEGWRDALMLCVRPAGPDFIAALVTGQTM